MLACAKAWGNASLCSMRPCLQPECLKLLPIRAITRRVQFSTLLCSKTSLNHALHCPAGPEKQGQLSEITTSTRRASAALPEVTSICSGFFSSMFASLAPSATSASRTAKARCLDSSALISAEPVLS